MSLKYNFSVNRSLTISPRLFNVLTSHGCQNYAYCQQFSWKFCRKKVVICLSYSPSASNFRAILLVEIPLGLILQLLCRRCKCNATNHGVSHVQKCCIHFEIEFLSLDLHSILYYVVGVQMQFSISMYLVPFAYGSIINFFCCCIHIHFAEQISFFFSI